MKKILLADDDETILFMSKEIIQDYFPNYEIQTFSDGELLENRLKEDLNGVRLIITDNEMPKITGREIIQKYSKEKEFEKIPFILCYGGDNEIGIKAIEDGAFDFIRKAFGIKEYISPIKKALKYSKNK